MEFTRKLTYLIKCAIFSLFALFHFSSFAAVYGPSVAEMPYFTITWTNSAKACGGYNYTLSEYYNGVYTRKFQTNSKSQFVSVNKRGHYQYRLTYQWCNSSGSSGGLSGGSHDILVEYSASSPVKWGEQIDIQNLNQKDKSFDVVWRADSGDSITGYQIAQEFNNSLGAWTSIPASTNTVSKTNMAPGVYRYHVKAIHSSGASDTRISAPVTITGVTSSASVNSSYSEKTNRNVGITAAHFRVSESGAATYQVPINLPAGTAGVQPEVSLSYSSQGGDGLLGLGWFLSAGGQVSRCPKNLAIDNQLTGIDLSNNDQFCLDGQRLFAKDGHAYGGNGSEYYTRIDGFAKITSHGAATGSGPRYFKVETKAGETFYYGNTEDSFVEPDFATSKYQIAKYWALNRIEDVKGNTIDFFYEEDVDNGKHKLKSIEYGGNRIQQTSHYNKVEFLYKENPKAKAGYWVGSKFRLDELLDAVEVTVNGDSFRYYQLDYFTSEVIEEHNYLLTIQECISASQINCRKPLSFKWNKNDPKDVEVVLESYYDYMSGHYVEIRNTGDFDYVPFKTAQQTLVDLSSHAQETLHIMDINGDGYDDFVYEDAGWKVHFGPNYNSYPQSISTRGSANSVRKHAQIIDFNGDGKLDLIVADSKENNWYLLYYEKHIVPNGICVVPGPSTGSCYQKADLTVQFKTLDLGRTAVGLEDKTMIMDVDGDGFQDIVFLSGNTLKMYRNEFAEGGTLGGAKTLTTISGYPNALPQTYVSYSPEFKNSALVDFNGDGATDMLLKVTTQTTGCWVDGQRVEADYGNCLYGHHGEWKTTPATDWMAFESQPNGANSTLIQTASFADLGEKVRVADFNGDGLADLAYHKSTSWYYKLSTGNGFLSARSFIGGVDEDKADSTIFIDLNRDGRTDVLKPNGNNWDVYLSSPTSVHDLASFPKRGVITKNSNQASQFGDVNGDGFIDLLYTTGGKWSVKYNNQKYPVNNVISEFDNGWGVKNKIGYDTILNPDVYVSKGVADSKTLSPAMPMAVVSKVESDVTEDSVLAVEYQYGGLRFHREGFGNLGFEIVITKDLQTGVKSVTQYQQDADLGIYTGMPIKTSQYYENNGSIVLLSEATNQLNHKTTANGAYFPFIEKSTDLQYQLTSDLTQAFISKTVSDFVYDNWGNLTSSDVYVYDEYDDLLHTTANSNLYSGAGGGAAKGRLSSSTVTKTCTNTANCDNTSSITRTSTFDYYSNGLLEWSKVNGLTTTYTYDSFGNKTKVAKTGALAKDGGQVVTIAAETVYNSNGRFVTKTKSAGLETSFKYNDLSESSLLTVGVINQTQTTTPNNETSIQHSDIWGTVVASKTSASPYQYSETEYCATAGCDKSQAYYQTKTTQAGSPTQIVEFDRFGREILVKVQHFNGGWRYKQTTYDSQGRVEKSYVPALNLSSSYYSQNFYDELGRVYKIKQSNGGYVQNYFYGLTTQSEDPYQNLTTTEQNSLGQTIKVIDALDGELAYQYDAFSNLTQVKKRADGQEYTQVTNVYSAFGEKMQMTDLDKGTWHYKYNAFGEVVWQQDAQNNQTDTEFDDLGRKIRVASTNSTQCWGYGDTNDSNNAKGRLVETRTYSNNVACNTANPNQVSKMYYDNQGRVYRSEVQYTGILSELNGVYNSYTSFDQYGRAYKQYYPTLGLSIRTDYNSYGYAYRTVNDKTGRVYQQINELDAHGKVKQVTYANGVKEYQTTDTATGLPRIQTVDIGTAEIHRLGYNYYLDGSLDARSLNFSSGFKNYVEDYQYDALRRLKQRKLTLNGSVAYENYTYNGFGDFTAKNGKNFQFDDANRHRPSGYDGNSFAYNLNGDMTHAQGNTIGYYSFNKPSKITKNDTTWTEFVYGMQHARYYRHDVRGSKNKHTLYLGAAEKVYTTTGGIHSFEYKFYIGNIVITESTNNSQSQENYLHKDHLGSPVTITDKSGLVVQRTVYDPWGKSSSISGGYSGISNLFESRTFTGHESIDDLNIIHMNGRIYEPTLGRFLQADPHIQAPKNSQNFNRYSYVLNNPLSFTDPSGYFFKKLLKGLMELTGTRPLLRSLAKNKYLNFIAQMAACGFGGPIGCAAYAGAQTFAVTGSLNASIKAGAIAYATSEVFEQIGAHFDGLSANPNTAGTIKFGGNWLTPGQITQQITAHAVVGGVTAELQGGKFGHGFFAAGVTKGAGGFMLPGGENLSTGEIIGGTIASAIIGGTASVIAGGKFENGAKTAAFQYLFNQAGKTDAWSVIKRTWNDYWSGVIESDPVLNYLKNNADLSAEASGCFGPCVKVEGELTNQYGASANGSLLTEWGSGLVWGAGSDITLFNSRNVVMSDGDWSLFKSFSLQLGPVGISSTRFEDSTGLLNTNVELNLRFPGGFQASGGTGVKKW